MVFHTQVAHQRSLALEAVSIALGSQCEGDDSSEMVEEFRQETATSCLRSTVVLKAVSDST